MNIGGLVSGIVGGSMLLFSAAPSSTNYLLKSYDVGTGGEDTLSSTNYRLNGLTGSQSGGSLNSTNYSVKSGETVTQNSNVPPAPTFSNPSSYYNKLLLVLQTGGNPTDTKFAIAISTDGFTTTRYIKSDHAIGNSLASGDYQTYAAWGSASGFLVLGLTPSTTYQVKVKAMQGNFTETGYGPVATVATVATSLSLSTETTLTSTPPFNVGFSSLAAGSVFNGDADALVGISTNAENGAAVYIKGNGGLSSSLAAYTVNSATADLSSTSQGYGALVTSVSQTSGGPLASTSPFGSGADNVGIISTALQTILSSATPITNGQATIRFKAKTEAITPSATDYSDTVNIVATGLF